MSNNYVYPVWSTSASSPFSQRLLATISHPRVPLPATTNGCVSLSAFNTLRNNSSDSPNTFTKGIPTCDMEGWDMDARTSSWNSTGPTQKKSSQHFAYPWKICSSCEDTWDHEKMMWWLRRHFGRIIVLSRMNMRYLEAYWTIKRGNGNFFRERGKSSNNPHLYYIDERMTRERFADAFCKISRYIFYAGSFWKKLHTKKHMPRWTLRFTTLWSSLFIEHSPLSLHRQSLKLCLVLSGQAFQRWEDFFGITEID